MSEKQRGTEDLRGKATTEMAEEARRNMQLLSSFADGITHEYLEMRITLNHLNPALAMLDERIREFGESLRKIAEHTASVKLSAMHPDLKKGSVKDETIKWSTYIESLPYLAAGINQIRKQGLGTVMKDTWSQGAQMYRDSHGISGIAAKKAMAEAFGLQSVFVTNWPSSLSASPANSGGGRILDMFGRPYAGAGSIASGGKSNLLRKLGIGAAVAGGLALGAHMLGGSDAEASGGGGEGAGRRGSLIPMAAGAAFAAMPMLAMESGPGYGGGFAGADESKSTNLRIMDMLGSFGPKIGKAGGALSSAASFAGPAAAIAATAAGGFAIGTGINKGLGKLFGIESKPNEKWYEGGIGGWMGEKLDTLIHPEFNRSREPVKPPEIKNENKVNLNIRLYEDGRTYVETDLNTEPKIDFRRGYMD